MIGGFGWACVCLKMVILGVLGPLLLGIAWRIKREDGGPVFYMEMRVGLQGKPFRVYKFRTVVGYNCHFGVIMLFWW